MTGFALGSGLFVLAFTIHNLEEATLLPAWSRSAGRWHPPVGAREFRFAVAVLTLLACLAARWAVVGGKGSVGAYLVEGFALASVLNVLFPHGLATIVMRRYAPGTATAVLLTLPAAILLLQRGLAEGYVEVRRLAWSGPLTVAGMLALIPVLFALGRRLTGARQG